MCTSSLLKRLPLVSDDRGFVVSAELVMLATITILGLTVGLTAVRDAAISELSDVAGAVQDLNQCYSINGVEGHSALSHGSSFSDATDWCDEADDVAGEIANCVTFTDPTDESGSGGVDGGGDDGGGDDGGGDDGGGDDGGGDDDFGTPADGALISDNFQDGNGNAPFNLQVRNTATMSGDTTEWTAVLSSVPYATIPGLVPGNYTLTTTMNPDGTFQHVFMGTTELDAGQSITITGGTPSPAGVGGTSNVDLFIP